MDANETLEERLDRLEQEEAVNHQKEEESSTMAQLERRTLDTETQMAVGDALDAVRFRNARHERLRHTGSDPSVGLPSQDEAEAEAQRKIEDDEDTQIAKRAFATHASAQVETLDIDVGTGVFERAVPESGINRTISRPRKKQKGSLLAGLKKKESLEAKSLSLVADYDSDST